VSQVATTRSRRGCSSERAADDARVGHFGVADDASFVDVFVREADVGNGNLLLIQKKVLVCPRCNLAPLLRCVVLVGEAALGAGFDLAG
jgi:hypothetical protein